MNSVLFDAGTEVLYTRHIISRFQRVKGLMIITNWTLCLPVLTYIYVYNLTALRKENNR
jgi:hypothetical protein